MGNCFNFASCRRQRTQEKSTSQEQSQTTTPKRSFFRRRFLKRGAKPSTKESALVAVAQSTGEISTATVEPLTQEKCASATAPKGSFLRRPFRYPFLRRVATSLTKQSVPMTLNCAPTSVAPSTEARALESVAPSTQKSAPEQVAPTTSKCALASVTQVTDECAPAIVSTLSNKCGASTASVALAIQKSTPVTHESASPTMALSSLERVLASAWTQEHAEETRRALAPRLGSITFVDLSGELATNSDEENTFLRQALIRPVAGRLTFMDLTASDIIPNELYSGKRTNYRFSTNE